MEPMGLKVASKKLRTLAALPGLTHATTRDPQGGGVSRCLHERAAFPTPASASSSILNSGSPATPRARIATADRSGSSKPYTSYSPQFAAILTLGWLSRSLVDELAAATASPATSYEQKVEATDPEPRPSDGGNEPGVVLPPVPVRTELPQPVVGDVVTETEDGVPP